MFSKRFVFRPPSVAIIGLAMCCTLAVGAMTCFAELNVLCTTFPIHLITCNVAQGREGVNLQLLLPASMGCPHDYALTPQDMRKLAEADVLVVNGLGMEEFFGAPVEPANPKITLLDSSVGISNLLPYAHEHHDAEEDHDDHDAHDKDAEHHESEEHHHHHEGVNPHLFVSPRMAGLIAMNIAEGLSKADPEGADLYAQNAKTYVAKMDTLANAMAALGKTLKNNRIVEPHGVFDYLARDMGLEIVAVMQAHGQEPSAAEMLELIHDIRDGKAGAIFTEPQYSSKVGETLARETGLPVAVLDPGATGPEQAPLNFMEIVMRKNMEILSATLGVNP